MSSYAIFVRPEVESDLKHVSKSHQKRIFSAIEARLTEAPERYGRPLGGSLKRLRRLRVGDSRVAYQIEKNRVIIWAILHRKDIYREITKRYGGRP